MHANATNRLSGILTICTVLFVGQTLFAAQTARAGDVDVVDATIDCADDRVCTISASLLHADTGWDHYADAWRVLLPDGTEIGRRVLMHPHENEQPFTRSQSGIEIPEGVDMVIIEGHDSVHGFSGARFELKVPAQP